jgi:hypothetical protein
LAQGGQLFAICFDLRDVGGHVDDSRYLTIRVHNGGRLYEHLATLSIEEFNGFFSNMNAFIAKAFFDRTEGTDIICALVNRVT